VHGYQCLVEGSDLWLSGPDLHEHSHHSSSVTYSLANRLFAVEEKAEVDVVSPRINVLLLAIHCDCQLRSWLHCAVSPVVIAETQYRFLL
jgi:hypothetical protein